MIKYVFIYLPARLLLHHDPDLHHVKTRVCVYDFAWFPCLHLSQTAAQSAVVPCLASVGQRTKISHSENWRSCHSNSLWIQCEIDCVWLCCKDTAAAAEEAAVVELQRLKKAARASFLWHKLTQEPALNKHRERGGSRQVWRKENRIRSSEEEVKEKVEVKE